MTKNFIRLGLIAIIFIFLFSGIYQHWTQIQNYPWRESFHPFLFLLSLLILSFYFLGSVVLWKKLLSLNGDSLSFSKCFPIFIYSSVGKYLPGKVWVFVGRVYLAEKEGMDRQKALLSVFLETGLIILSGLMVSFLSPVFWSGNVNKYYFPSLLCAFVLALFFVFPRFFAKVLNFFLSRLGQRPILMEISTSQLMTMGGMYVCLWWVLGSAFYLFINSIYSIPLKDYPAVLGTLSFAWILGLLSLFAPGGLGVREGLLTLLLKQWLPLEIVLVVALGSRIWITLMELLCLIIASVLKFIEVNSPST